MPDKVVKEFHCCTARVIRKDKRLLMIQFVLPDGRIEEFNFNWAEQIDEDRQEWLAQVFSRCLNNAYYSGQRSIQKELAQNIQVIFKLANLNSPK